MISPQALLKTIRAELKKVADPRKAPAMQAYMKSAMPFHGVPSPVFKPLIKAQLKGLVFEDFAQLAAAVRGVWHGAAFREERYAALRLLDRRSHQPAAEALALFEELIHTGAWWDVVDDIANHWLHPLLASDPALTRKTLERWSRSDDLWLRRAAIVAQVHAGKDTDVPLLFKVIEPAIDEKEFFLRKGIGWALRALAKDFPRETQRWLAKYESRASGLTIREARKGLDRHPRPKPA